MAKYGFLSFPAYGHVSPALAAVQELARRPHHAGTHCTAFPGFPA
jgi:UDP:flavonoid glycosyltransferase YjiC (YdhE family)